jgi:TPR repeat protein
MRPTWKVVVVLIFASCSGIVLHAQQADADRKLFEETKTKAEAGDAAAQYDLGRLYKSGRGVAKDAVAYHGWIRKSAEHGFAQAQTTLADMLLSDTNSWLRVNISEVRWHWVWCG